MLRRRFREHVARMTLPRDAVSARLESFPRVRLAHLPTPLERLPRLGEALGVEIWVKRDDATGLAIGGNKVRKLEYLLGAADAEGVDTVITVGGVQSNHARQTAAACARLGLRCQLVLPRVVPIASEEYERSGNVLLDHLFGAEVFVVEDEAAAAKTLGTLLEAATREGRHAVVYPPGGSTPVGSLGYVAAARELRAQLVAGEGTRFARVYLASSTGGTLAGLACGLGDAVPEVLGVCVAGSEQQLGTDFEQLRASVRELLGAGDDTPVRLTDRFLGPGYGLPSAGTLEAVGLCASLEGLLIDPVYTGKAMEALVSDARAGRCPGPVLFWHTGGTPGLFAYRDAFESD